jgi:predicted dehydrogenase
MDCSATSLRGPATTPSLRLTGAQRCLSTPLAGVTLLPCGFAGVTLLPCGRRESPWWGLLCHIREVVPASATLLPGLPRECDIAHQDPRPKGSAELSRTYDRGVADTVKIGLVGYGFGGRYFHAPLIASAPGVELAGVVTRSPERRAEISAEQPGVETFDTLADLAASGVRAVAISTPADTHMALVHEAIGLGMAVVCDKPFALDAAAARAAVLAAESAGVALTVYQNRRWDADLLTVQRLLIGGELGSIVRFESRFERFQPESGPPASGGGLLRDFGSHLFDQALYLFGAATSVYAELKASPEGEPTTEDRFFAALTHQNGVISHLGGNWVEGAPGPRFRVTGTEGTYLLDKTMEIQEHLLIAGRSPATEGNSWGVEPKEDWGRIQRGDTATPVPTERGRWDTFYPAFAAAVQGESPVPVNPWDAVAALEVIDAARTSARERRVVPIEPFTR